MSRRIGGITVPALKQIEADIREYVREHGLEGYQRIDALLERALHDLVGAGERTVVLRLALYPEHDRRCAHGSGHERATVTRDQG
jgi:hypothetical protein